LNDFNPNYLEKCQKDIYSEGNQLSSDDQEELIPSVIEDQKFVEYQDNQIRDKNKMNNLLFEVDPLRTKQLRAESPMLL